MTGGPHLSVRRRGGGLGGGDADFEGKRRKAGRAGGERRREGGLGRGRPKKKERENFICFILILIDLMNFVLL
jgi:hypothetical protein